MCPSDTDSRWSRGRGREGEGERERERTHRAVEGLALVTNLRNGVEADREDVCTMHLPVRSTST